MYEAYDNRKDKEVFVSFVFFFIGGRYDYVVRREKSEKGTFDTWKKVYIGRH